MYSASYTSKFEYKILTLLLFLNKKLYPTSRVWIFLLNTILEDHNLEDNWMIIERISLGMDILHIRNPWFFTYPSWGLTLNLKYTSIIIIIKYIISQILDKFFKFQREREQLFVPLEIAQAPSTFQATYLSPLDDPFTKGCDYCDTISGTVNDIQLEWINSILELCK
jgi:hypothetical protein